MISKIIMLFHKITFAPKKETIAVSNLFSNKVMKEVRSNFSYSTNYYIEVK